MRSRTVVAGALVVVGVVVFLALHACEPEPLPDPSAPIDPAPAAPATQPHRAATPQAQPKAAVEDAPADETAPEVEPTETGTLDVRIVSAATGEPVADVELIVRPAGIWGIRRGRTGEDGRVRVDGVIVGPVFVEAERPPDRGDLAAAQTVLAVCPGERVIEWPRALRLEGRLEGASGGALAQFRLVYEGGPRFRPRDVRGEIHPGPDGAFAEPVDPGLYDVWTESTGREAGEWARARLDRVDPAAGPLVVVLRPAAHATGVPVDRSNQSYYAGLATLPVASDGPGFRLVGPGSYGTLGRWFDSGAVTPESEIDLWVRAGPSLLEPAVGWGVARRVRPPRSGLEIVVEPARTLEVTLVDDRGNPPGEALQVTARPAGTDRAVNPSFAAYGTATPGGLVVLRGLPPTDLHVLLHEPGGRWCVPEPVRVVAGTEAVTIRVVRTVRVTGRIVLRSGAAVRDGGHLLLLGPQQRDPVIAQVRRGSFRADGLVPGRVLVAFEWPYELAIDLGEIDAPARDVVLELPVGR